MEYIERSLPWNQFGILRRLACEKEKEKERQRRVYKQRGKKHKRKGEFFFQLKKWERGIVSNTRISNCNINFLETDWKKWPCVHPCVNRAEAINDVSCWREHDATLHEWGGRETRVEEAKQKERETERVGLKRGTVKFSPPRNCYYSRSIYERDIWWRGGGAR